MRLSQGFLCLVSIFLVQQCPGAKTPDTVAVRDSVEFVSKEKKKLKDAAFCLCFKYGGRKYDSLLIKDGSMGGYFETSKYSYKAFDVVDSAARSWSKNDYKSEYGDVPLTIMKCLDFYRSSELDSLVNKLSPRLNASNWRRPQ